MPLFLIETLISNPTQLKLIREEVHQAAVEVGARPVESRATKTGDRLFFVFEFDDGEFLQTTVRLIDHEARVTEVRLVGATVEEVRAEGGGNFLTEWDFPDGLTMDTYLASKAEKSPLYGDIAEVEFRRTYVKEDMGGCLCFYDASCEEDVILARKKVDTPVDRIAEVE